MAYEPLSQRVVLFGGYHAQSGQQLMDTWEWDRTTWSQIATAAAPSPRETFGMCEDGAGGILLFGGMSFSSGIKGDTWRYAQGAWTMLHANQGPSPRRYLAMVATPQGPILFGGADSVVSQCYGDTWRWNGSSWVALASAQSPSPRCVAGISFDSNRNRVVLFGGRQPGGILLDETWEWNGASWLLRAPALRPPAREATAFIYSSHFGRSLLFGGLGLTGLLDDAWSWDGTSWSSVALGPRPSPRNAPGLAHDGPASSLLLFGGWDLNASLGDTWELLPPPHLAAFVTFGSGCPAPNGQTPVLAGVPPELPRIGGAARMRVSNLPAGVTVPIFVLGVSDSINSGPVYPLPFDLGVLGWSGCSQWVSHDTETFTITTSGQSDLLLQVPPNPTLAGQHFFAQALVLYHPSGVAVSNGLRLAIGY
jgi:hypothetical protein